MTNPTPTTDTHTDRACWSEARLQAYHDGELDPALCERLEADLASNPKLTDRLQALGRLDDLISRALRRPPVATAAPARAWRWAVLGAGMLGAAAITIVVLPRAGGPATAGPVEAVPIDSQGPAPTITRADGPAPSPTAPGVLELARWVVPAGRGPHDQAATRPAPPEIEATTPRIEPQKPGALADVSTTTISESMARSLRRGEVNDAIAMIQTTSAEHRIEASSALGEAIRSAHAAQRVLDGLDPQLQLEVVAVWARDPHLRPVAFARLAQLAKLPAMSEPAHRLADELSTQPGLDAWVRSAGLALHRP